MLIVGEALEDDAAADYHTILCGIHCDCTVHLGALQPVTCFTAMFGFIVSSRVHNLRSRNDLNAFCNSIGAFQDEYWQVELRFETEEAMTLMLGLSIVVIASYSLKSTTSSVLLS